MNKAENAIQGELVEIEFLKESLKRKFIPCKPPIAQHYDYILDIGNKCIKIQVKSTRYKQPRKSDTYILNVSRGGGKKNKDYAYVDGDYDFMAAFIVPEQIWFIIPANKVVGKTKIRLTTKRIINFTGQAFDEYKEAWHLLK